jgi:hypothetical protein
MRGKRFEARFEGPSNKGLRALIRKRVASEDSCPTRGHAVLSLASTIAFTAMGLHTLTEVACDYNTAEEIQL